MNAAPDRTAAMRHAKDERRKRLERAVADVMEEGHTISATYRNRLVPETQLREALAAAGWKPCRVRQTSSRSRAKQLSQRRGDNQS